MGWTVEFEIESVPTGDTYLITDDYTPATDPKPITQADILADGPLVTYGPEAGYMNRDEVWITVTSALNGTCVKKFKVTYICKCTTCDPGFTWDQEMQLCYRVNEVSNSKYTNIVMAGKNAGVDANTLDINGHPIIYLGNPTDIAESTATYSDEVSGMLRLFVAGTRAYKGSDLVTPIATDLLGGSNSTNTIVVRQPGTNIYHIFTFPNGGTGHGMIYRHRYDATSETFLEKNVKIITGTTEFQEKIAVVFGLNNDVWVVARTYFGGQFYTWNITQADGWQDSTLQIQTIGNPTTALASFVGGMKFASVKTGNKVKLGIALSTLYTYDFDLTTGVFSNEIVIDANPSGHLFYGLEFSSNGRYLAATNFSTKDLIRYDLNAAGPSFGKTIVANIPGIGQIQLFSNGRIYGAKEGAKTLFVLNTPNDASPGFSLTSHANLPGAAIWHIGLCLFVIDTNSFIETQPCPLPVMP